MNQGLGEGSSRPQPPAPDLSSNSPCCTHAASLTRPLPAVPRDRPGLRGVRGKAGTEGHCVTEPGSRRPRRRLEHGVWIAPSSPPSKENCQPTNEDFRGQGVLCSNSNSNSQELCDLGHPGLSLSIHSSPVVQPCPHTVRVTL